MQVLDKNGDVIDNVYCIGDANGKLMLAHAASAQGISAVETMSVRRPGCFLRTPCLGKVRVARSEQSDWRAKGCSVCMYSISLA
jgi:hypothetical protein